MRQHTAESDFERLSWHDNIVYGLRLDVGDSFRGDWHRDLVFDIDHIVEWVCGVDGGVRFLVAPATLTFHDATDLGIAVDFGDSGGRTVLNELSIAGITRVAVPNQEGYPERSYYRWRIELNLPQGGEITFGASGFTQTLRAEPVLLDEQYERKPNHENRMCVRDLAAGRCERCGAGAARQRVHLSGPAQAVR